MKHHKVLETVFIDPENGNSGTFGLILEDSIKIQIFRTGEYLTWEQALEDIKETKPGWVQTSDFYNSRTPEEVERDGKGYINEHNQFVLPTDRKDPVGGVKKIFDDLQKYADENHYN